VQSRRRAREGSGEALDVGSGLLVNNLIRQAAIEEGMVLLRQDAIKKVVAGWMTPAEILRAVYLEE
jgi:hypothetical protein